MLGSNRSSDMDDLKGATGYKNYIIAMGFAPLIFLFLSFIFVLFSIKDNYYRRFALSFLIIYILSFLQRPQTGAIYLYMFYLYTIDNPFFGVKKMYLSGRKAKYVRNEFLTENVS